MIPTMIVFGLVFGRWWRFALPLAAVVWDVMLLADGVMGIELGLIGAALLAVANAGVGVVAHQGILQGYRRLRRGSSRGPRATTTTA